jgi:hypothetical protein
MASPPTTHAATHPATPATLTAAARRRRCRHRRTARAFANRLARARRPARRRHQAQDRQGTKSGRTVSSTRRASRAATRHESQASRWASSRRRSGRAALLPDAAPAGGARASPCRRTPSPCPARSSPGADRWTAARTSDLSFASRFSYCLSDQPKCERMTRGGSPAPTAAGRAAAAPPRAARGARARRGRAACARRRARLQSGRTLEGVKTERGPTEPVSVGAPSSSPP